MDPRYLFLDTVGKTVLTKSYNSFLTGTKISLCRGGYGVEDPNYGSMYHCIFNSDLNVGKWKTLSLSPDTLMKISNVQIKKYTDYSYNDNVITAYKILNGRDITPFQFKMPNLRFFYGFGWVSAAIKEFFISKELISYKKIIPHIVEEFIKNNSIAETVYVLSASVPKSRKYRIPEDISSIYLLEGVIGVKASMNWDHRVEYHGYSPITV